MNCFIRNFEISDHLRKRAKAPIPDAAHTSAKGYDQYTILSPGIMAGGSGCHVWDVDDNEYIEYGMGNRAVGLGYAYTPVLDTVRRELEFGCNFTRPSKIEVECATASLQTVATADMIKFAKDGRSG
ncbi:hypothetical protein ATY79_11265 [Rhizobium sp. R693]|nr:hypothetical protein ATY79_11265 [Rhizobium sp. R693]